MTAPPDAAPVPSPPRPSTRRLNGFLGTGLVGALALLGGLTWDALLHGDDPGLAGHEGVFTLANPSHALFLGGILMVVVGVAGALDTNLRGGALGRSRPRLGVAASGAVAVVLATSLAAAGWAMSSAPHGTEPLVSHAHGGAADGAVVKATPQQQAEADALLAATSEAIGGYADEGAARAAGFRPIQPPTSRYVHYVNFDYLADSDVLDPDRPESLVYRSTPAGLALEAAMFILPSVESPVPDMGGLAQSWHRHDDLCFSTATAMIVGVDDARACPPGSVNQVTPPMLHVWTVDHPGGPFAGL